MSNTYRHIHTVLLAAYIASLVLISFEIVPGVSLSFILAIVWGVSKLWKMLWEEKKFQLRLEGILLGALYLCLVGLDFFVHDGSLKHPYYVSFALNGVLFLLLVDEFAKTPAMREKMMAVFSIGIVLVALLFLGGVFVTQSQSGRLTFMHQNENELAVNLLIAVTFVVVHFLRNVPGKLTWSVATYVSALLLLNALVYTGTRFALWAAVIVLLMLGVAAFKTPHRWRINLFASVCLAFIVSRVVSFAPTLDRLTPEVTGNNLQDFGGRTELWREAIKAWSQSPFLGLGYEGFQDFALEQAQFFEMPHNFILEVAAIGGSLSLTILAVLVFVVLRRVYSYSLYSKSLDALIWCVPVFVTPLMLNVTHMKAFWFLAAYFIMAVPLLEKNAEDDAGVMVFVRKQMRRVSLIFFSIPGYLLYFFYGYGKFHVTPLRYKHYCIDILKHINKRTNKNGLLDIGCGTGDVLLNANYIRRVGLDHNANVLKALRLRARLSRINIEAKLYRFGVDEIEGLYDVIVICNWIHNIDPILLQAQFEQLFNCHLNVGGELIFDTVKGDHYPHFHDEYFLSRNINAKITGIGEYTSGHLSGSGVRRVISFQRIG